MQRALLLIWWLLFAPPLLAAGVELEARLWSVDLSGTVRADGGGGGAASELDLDSELGIGGDEPVEARLVWRPSKRTSVRLGWLSFGFTGQAELEETIRFGGEEFLVSSLTSSSLDLDYGRLGFAWQFLSNRAATLRLGPLVEVKGFRGEAGLSADLLGLVTVSAREEVEAAFGAAGLVLDLEPSRKLHLFAEWTALVGADEGDLTDAEAGVRYALLANLAVAAGYRTIQIDIEEGGDRLDVDLDGFWLGAVLSF